MLILNDGDVIAHQAASLAHRYKQTGYDGFDQIHRIVDDKYNISFTEDDDREFLDKCYKSFVRRIEEIKEKLFADDILTALKSPYNYRKDMFFDYKMNRHKDSARQNPFVQAVRQKAIEDGLGIAAHGREADDLLRIWATQAELAGDPYAIVSVDKDLDCIPGLHYNPVTDEKYTVTPRDATKFFYQQLLSGDPTDNIPGVPKLGPIKAKLILNNIETEEEMQELVVEQYLNAFEDDWYDWLQSNGKMIYIQKAEHDFFTCANWPVVKALRVPIIKEIVEPAIPKIATLKPPILRINK